jgi:DNA polymerase-4
VIGALIRSRVHSAYGITCSVGVASTKFVAKLASTRCKPDGLLVVPHAEVLAFLRPLPVAALWGVGQRTGTQLANLGLRTVADLAELPLSALRRAVGDAQATHLHELAWGRDPRRVTTDTPDKSIGAEETFSSDVTEPEAIRRELLRLSDRAASRLRSTGQAGRTVSIKIRFGDFTTISRSKTLGAPTDVTRDVYETARGLFDALGTGTARIRLVGVRIEGLVAGASFPRQLELGARERGWKEAEQAMDEAVRRFGHGMVKHATLVERREESGR